MSTYAELGIVLLAAGASLRMKQPKALLHYQGETLIQRAIHLSQSLAARHLWVISGAYTQEFQTLYAWDDQTSLHHNPEWQEGMASGIRLGVHLASKQENIKGILILLVDQPKLEAKHLQGLADIFLQNPEKPAACFYRNIKGTPAIFPPSMFTALLSLSGDKGAGNLLNAAQQEVSILDCPEAEWDVDTPADFLNLQ
jgi:molybdenum cofactor cytidylyltransferase